MGLLWIIFFLFIHYAFPQNDPCTDHQVLTDTKFRTDSNETGSDCSIFPPFGGPPWYRFTSTPSGEIATTCPQNSTCGATNQLWIKDSLPGIYNETDVHSCMNTQAGCCDLSHTIRVKNCNGFFVYKLSLLPSCSRFCINATAVLPPTLSTNIGSVMSNSKSIYASTTAVTTMHSTTRSPSTATSTEMTTVHSTTSSPSMVSSTNMTTVVSTSERTTIQTPGQTKRTMEINSQPINTIGQTSVGYNTLVITKTVTETKSSTIDAKHTSKSTERKHEHKKTSTDPSSDNSSIPIIVGASVGSIVGLAGLVLVSIYAYRASRKINRIEKSPVGRVHTKEQFVKNKRFNVHTLFDRPAGTDVEAP